MKHRPKEWSEDYSSRLAVEAVDPHIDYFRLDRRSFQFLIFHDLQSHVQWTLDISTAPILEIPSLVSRRIREMMLPKASLFILIVTHIEGGTDLENTDLILIQELHKVASITEFHFQDYIVRGFDEYFSLFDSERSTLGHGNAN